MDIWPITCKKRFIGQKVHISPALAQIVQKTMPSHRFGFLEPSSRVTKLSGLQKRVPSKNVNVRNDSSASAAFTHQ
jgi:hypothetical protein